MLALASVKGIHCTASKPGSFNTSTFLDFLAAADLPKGCVILLDNVSFHHSKAVKALAADRGWDLLYTLPYSPWFNPIEGMFSVVKRSYHKHGSIERAFACLTTQHAVAFFRNAMQQEATLS